jgi:hypothetical protein
MFWATPDEPATERTLSCSKFVMRGATFDLVFAAGMVRVGKERDRSIQQEVNVPEYLKLPTQNQWLTDMGQSGIKSIVHTKYSQAERIGVMLADLARMDSRIRIERIELLAHVLVEASFLSKYHNRADKLGKAALSNSQAGYASALQSCVAQMLAQLLGAEEMPQLQQKLNEFLSKEVGKHEKEKDKEMLSNKTIEWIEDEKLKVLKLSFRAGLAHRKNVVDGVVQLELYDTKKSGDAIEVLETSLFVMDGRGRIYVHGKEEGLKSLKHSSFLQGSPTKAAGTMQWDNGRLTIITNQSGHYKPGLRQMLTVLERLQAYQVNLSNTVFYRANFSDAWLKNPGNPRNRHLEPCNAADMLRKRCFTRAGCQHPNSLCILQNGAPPLIE